jgi:hypothetical protein
MSNDPLPHQHRILVRQFTIGQVGRLDGQGRGQLPGSLAVRTVTRHAVPLENLSPMEQLGQESLGVICIGDHAKAGDSKQRAETKKRRQAWALSHCEAMVKIDPGIGLRAPPFPQHCRRASSLFRGSHSNEIGIRKR